MYATGMDGVQNTGLFSVNKNTGAATLIAQTGGQFTGIYGLGFRSDGTLFANGQFNYSINGNSDLMIVDPSNGATTDVGPEGVTLGRELTYSGLVFRADGTLLSLGSITASADGLYSVNTATGAATLLGPTGIDFGVDGGLTFAPGQPESTVPEPSTSLLCLLGLGLLWTVRSRLPIV
jgi:hypothetical protein